MAFGNLGALGARGGFGSLGSLGGAGVPSWVVNRGNAPDIALDFMNDRAWKKAGGLSSSSSLLSVSRASSKTNLLPTSASGFVYSTFLSNVASITSLGALIEEARTNVLLNSTAPVTQTTASLGTGTYTLWVNGSGSATSSAASATITGAGAATNGSPNTFVVTVAGTVTITVSGSLNAFQCELGTFGTSLIVTAGSAATRSADVVTLTTPPTFGGAYSLYGKGTPQTLVGAPSLFVVDNGGAAQELLLGLNGTPIVYYPPGGVVQHAGSWSANVSGKIAGAAAATDQAGAFNGGSLQTSAFALNATPSAVRFGSTAGPASYWNGFVEYAAVWASQRVSNAELLSMTT